MFCAVSVQNNVPLYKLSNDIIAILQEYNWPYNVVELKNIIELQGIVDLKGLVELECLVELEGILQTISSSV